MWLVKLALQNLVLPFLVPSQPNVDGFCFNMGHLKAIPRTVGPNQDRSFAPQRPQDQSSKNPRTLDRLAPTKQPLLNGFGGHARWKSGRLGASRLTLVSVVSLKIEPNTRC